MEATFKMKRRLLLLYTILGDYLLPDLSPLVDTLVLGYHVLSYSWFVKEQRL